MTGPFFMWRARQAIAEFALLKAGFSADILIV